jgi:hypothetical protein
VHEEVEPAPVARRCASKTASSEAASCTSAGITMIRAEALGERDHPPPEALALVGEGELGAVRGSTRAMPQAIEWSLATPEDQAALARHQQARDQP